MSGPTSAPILTTMGPEEARLPAAWTRPHVFPNARQRVLRMPKAPVSVNVAPPLPIASPRGLRRMLSEWPWPHVLPSTGAPAPAGGQGPLHLSAPWGSACARAPPAGCSGTAGALQDAGSSLPGPQLPPSWLQLSPRSSAMAH